MFVLVNMLMTILEHCDPSSFVELNLNITETTTLFKKELRYKTG